MIGLLATSTEESCGEIASYTIRIGLCRPPWPGCWQRAGLAHDDPKAALSVAMVDSGAPAGGSARPRTTTMQHPRRIHAMAAGHFSAHDGDQVAVAKADRVEVWGGTPLVLIAAAGGGDGDPNDARRVGALAAVRRGGTRDLLQGKLHAIVVVDRDVGWWELLVVDAQALKLSARGSFGIHAPRSPRVVVAPGDDGNVALVFAWAAGRCAVVDAVNKTSTDLEAPFGEDLFVTSAAPLQGGLLCVACASHAPLATTRLECLEAKRHRDGRGDVVEEGPWHVEHVSPGARVCAIRNGNAVACVTAYEARLFRASNGEAMNVATFDEPRRSAPSLVMPLGDVVVVCSATTEALRFDAHGALISRVVAARAFDCAAWLGDRCVGAGPMGSAVVKFSADAASTVTGIMDACGDVSDACVISDRVVCVGGGSLWSTAEARLVDDAAYDVSVPRATLFAVALSETTLVVAGHDAVLLKGDAALKAPKLAKALALHGTLALGFHEKRIVHVGPNGLRTCNEQGDDVAFHGTFVVNRFCRAAVDNGRVVAAGRDEIVAIDATGRKLAFARLPGEVSAMHLRGARVAVAYGSKAALFALDALGAPVDEVSLSEAAAAVRILADGTLAVATSTGVLVNGTRIVCDTVATFVDDALAQTGAGGIMTWRDGARRGSGDVVSVGNAYIRRDGTRLGRTSMRTTGSLASIGDATAVACVDGYIVAAGRGAVRVYDGEFDEVAALDLTEGCEATSVCECRGPTGEPCVALATRSPWSLAVCEVHGGQGRLECIGGQGRLECIALGACDLAAEPRCAEEFNEHVAVAAGACIHIISWVDGNTGDAWSLPSYDLRIISSATTAAPAVAVACSRTCVAVAARGHAVAVYAFARGALRLVALETAAARVVRSLGFVGSQLVVGCARAALVLDVGEASARVLGPPPPPAAAFSVRRLAAGRAVPLASPASRVLPGGVVVCESGGVVKIAL